ncbi:rhodanese-like domain-containing protein [Hydrogenophaga sp. 2FB]|uniref:rhodanese-like domain-containing protein n=1 Tax=Hydrogenophaga sp. 2FB TaxID=2502187 RepID=UPI0010F63B99|nr:rhodanese-like domain-containing protein [Hydrogenophaga sp. 2FB]
MQLHAPLAAVFFAALFTAWPAAAQSRGERLAAAEQQCQPGREARAAVAKGTPLPEGAMPLQLPGAITISPREANCMIEHMGLGLAVVAAMRTQEKIPGTLVEMPQVAGESEEIRQAYAKAFQGFTGGEKDMPMLFYCHHDRCQLSVLAVQRAKDAGYHKLYWLRAGNSGWVSAGLPLEREVLAKAATVKNQEAVRSALMEVRTCGIEVTDQDFVDIALKSPTDNALASNLRSHAEDDRKTRVNCLVRARDAVAKIDAQNPALAEIDALVSRAPDEIDRAYKAARARVEASPSTHFKAPLDKVSLGPLSAALEKARASKSARQTCGTFDRPMPNNQAQLNVTTSALADYRACLDRLEGATKSAATMAAMGYRTSDSDFDAQETLALVSGSARYRCSVRSSSGCLPDASWDRVAALATPANITAYEKSRSDQRNQSGDIDTLRAEANDWVDRVNAHIEQVEASRSRSSGGGYSVAPQSNTQPVRRPYGSSAAGMK